MSRPKQKGQQFPSLKAKRLLAILQRKPLN